METKFIKYVVLMLMIYGSFGLAQVDKSSKIEVRIRSGEIETSNLILPDHPRLWLRGEWDWDYNNYGSFAWRIVHAEPCSNWPSPDPACDNEMEEFEYVAGGEPGEGGRYGADKMYPEGHGSGMYSRVLEMIIAGNAVKRGWQNLLPLELGYTPDHTADEYFSEARERLLYITTPGNINLGYAVHIGSVAYDWLFGETYTDGTPVLSDTDKRQVQQGLTALADELKSIADGASLFNFHKLARYNYAMVGLSLYEPSRVGDPNYAAVNAKAKEYLDDFDTIWIGKVLPAWNVQGGDGGWHGGVTHVAAIDMNRSDWRNLDTVTPWGYAALLFAHYTATGQPIESSVFSSPVMKNLVEWQLYMVQPVDTPDWDVADYIPVNQVHHSNFRTVWSTPMRMYARRRFSNNPEQLKIAELGGWIRHNLRAKSTNQGSWDLLDQTIFEDKWPNARSPEELGIPKTRHFEDLGWVFMRTGFTSANDLVSLFIAQPYRWSELDAGHSQGTFYLERKGKLIEGFNNIIYIDNEGQRQIESFPTLDQGVEAYAPSSIYDVGPGIQRFESGTKYDNVYADVTNAYDSNKLEKFTRHIVYLKPDKFVMLDRVITRSPNYKKSWVIDPGAAPETVGDKLFVIRNGTGALWLKRLLPENTTIESQTSDRFEVTPIQPANEDFFLHVFQAVDSELSKDSPSVVADDAELLTNGDQIGARVGEWQVWFNQSGEINVLKNDIPVSVESKPANLVSFKAFVVRGSVILNWRTASETNNLGFEIQRSLDNVQFTKIGYVDGHGTTTASQSYQFLDEGLKQGRYYYRLKQISTAGSFGFSSSIKALVGLPQKFNLQQNYPNPFNPSTKIVYEIPSKSFVTIKVYNLGGSEVATLVHEEKVPGSYDITWDGKNSKGEEVASGIYLYKLAISKNNERNFSETKKMILLH